MPDGHRVDDAARLADQEHQRDAEHRGHDGDPQQRRDLVVEQFVAGQAQQRSDHRAGGVHRAVEPEHPSAGGVVDVGHQQRVARGAAKPLPSRSTTRPASTPCHARRRHHHLAERRQAVAGGDERAAREPVAERTGRELGQRRRALRRALDGADDGGRRAEHRGQVDRQQRVEQLTGGVLQKRHRREHAHVPGEPSGG